MLVLHRVLDIPVYAWIMILNMSDYAWVCLICLNMPEYAWICLLNDFCFTFSHCNPLSAWRHGYLFQHLHETRSYSLKKYEAVFLTRQNLTFPLVAESIWFNFCFRINIFTSKISNLLLSLGAEWARGCEFWYT